MNRTKRNNIGLCMIRFGAALLLVLVLVSCQDLSLFVDHLDDEVKLANDRYLEVVDTFPEQNDQNLSPKIDLLILLDRDVDPEKLKEYIHIEQRNVDGTVTIFGNSTVVSETMNLTFEPSDNTLTISPHPFWAGGNKITVSLLPGATGIDSSVLRDVYSWSFYTVKIPTGLVEIADGDHAQPGFTNVPTPAVKIFFSNAGEYYLGSDFAVIETADFEAMAWVPTAGKTGEVTVNSPTLGSGVQMVYVYFKDPSTNTISDYISDSIYIDLTVPSVEVGPVGVGPTNSSFSRTATASDGQSGIHSYLWTSSPAGLTFGTPSASGTTVIGPASTDQLYSVILTVTDKAGNSQSDSFSLDWDSQAPIAPVFTVVPVSPSTTDNTPTWTWANSASLDDILPYNYRINSGAWQTTASTTYTHSALPDGSHAFDVGQYDNANNFSYSRNTFIVNLANITPYNNQKNVPTNVTLDWPSTTLATYNYLIYTGPPPTKPNYVSTGSTSQSAPLNLSSNTSYSWGYSVTTKAGTATFGPYVFSTSFFRP